MFFSPEEFGEESRHAQRRRRRAGMTDEAKLAEFFRRTAVVSGMITIPPDIRRLPCGCSMPQITLSDLRTFDLVGHARALTIAELDKAFAAVARAQVRYQQVARASADEPWMHVPCRRRLLLPGQSETTEPESGNT